MSEIRIVTDDEYLELLRIVMEAYPDAGRDTGQSMEQHLERFRKYRRDKSWEPYGVFRNGKMVGVFRNCDFMLNVRGNLLSAGGLGMVAVDLVHKKEHVAKDIVEFFLNHYDSKGDAMATLWPFRVDFYHQMGFGLGSKMHRYSVKPASLPRGKTKEHVRYLTTEDIPALNDCYNRFYENRNGMIKHNEGRWQNRFEFAEKLRFVGCEINGRLEGYLIYSFKPPERPTSFMDNDLVVSEFFYHTPDALSELLTFLHTQLDQADRVVLQTPEEEFYFLMSDPTVSSGSKMAPTYHESHMSGVGIMYRVVNTKLVFAQLVKPAFGEVNIAVKINLCDSFFPGNNCSHVVRFEGGRGVVLDSGRSDVEITLDVAEFSSMIMGAVGFHRLYTYGLAMISDSSYLEQVDTLFTYHQKPVCVTGF